MTSLGEFKNICNKIKTAKKGSVTALHKFIYEDEGDRTNRRRIREFEGFDFSEDDEKYFQKFAYVEKNISQAGLISICLLLELQYDEANAVLHIFKNLKKNHLLAYNEAADNEDDEEESDEGAEDDGTEGEYDDAQSVANSQIQLTCNNGRLTSNAVGHGQQRPQRENKQRFTFNFRDIENSVRTFDGRENISIEAWIEEFEGIAVMMGWDQLQMFVFAKQSLKGIAKLFVSGEKGLNSWKLLRRGLLEEFGKKVNSADIHRMLSERKMAKDEDVYEYFYSMKDIAARGNVEDDALMQYVIDGIRDLHTHKAMLYGARTITEFKSKLNVYETFSKKQKNPRDGQLAAKQLVATHSKEPKKDLKCFNCGDKGHVSANCPSKSKGVKCFRCNKFGHIANNCSSTLKTTCLIAKVDKQYQAEVLIGNCGCVAIVDTGSEISLIRVDEYNRIGSPQLRPIKITFKGVGSQLNQTLGEFSTKVSVNDVEVEIIMHVVDHNILQSNVLLGTNFINQVDLHISRGVMSVSRPKDNRQDEDGKIPFIYKIDLQDDRGVNDLIHIKNLEHRKKVADMIGQYEPKKSKEVAIQTKIILKSDVPVAQRPRRLSPLEKVEVDKQIKIWLDNGVIRASNSEYASPIVLVKKKNGSTRICVDYRAVNKLIERPNFPLPIIEDQLDALQGGIVFSSIDLKDGFFHVPIAEGSEKYTAFVTPTGQYEFLKTPFGLAISPTVFQKFINAVFKELIEQHVVLTYMDDIIIVAQNECEALERLGKALKVASQHGLKINWRKCKFLQTEIEYLGHVVTGGTLKPGEAKIEAVMKFPKPTNVKKVQSFLGLSGYFRKFIPQYSLIAKPLTNLLKNDVHFEFGDREQEAFMALKEILARKPVLQLYKLGAETELHTDACRYGYGMLLMQKNDEDQKFHPVYYASGKTTPAEENYSSYELEVLAIVKALKKFRVYLLGIPFKIVTDCQAFSMTMKKKDLTVRVARWVLLLEEFNYEVCHRPGNNMKHADALSRNPLPNVLLINENKDSMLLRLKNAQNRDQKLSELIEAVRSNKSSEYSIKNGILYKSINDDFLVVVPKEMQTQVTRQAHERGHFGITKTEEIIKQDFWFEGLREKVESVIASCVNCILAERKQGKQEGFLHSIDKGEYPLDTYHIDHLGPMTLTKKRYQYILVVVDGFTKFVWIFPTRSTDAVPVVDSLKKLSVIFGNPRRIISDRGAAFTSGVFKDYCREEGIEHNLITTGVPRANGQVERINRVLIPLFTKLAAPTPENWYKYVDSVQRFLNNTTNRSTGRKPFQLLFGTNMRVKNEPDVQELLQKEWVHIFDTNRDDLRECAKKKIEAMQQANRSSYNKKRKVSKKYERGDLVAIKRTQYGPGLKLHGKFLGPYEITHVLRNDRYMVEKKSQLEGPRHTTTTADFMKPWVNDHDDE